MTPAPITAAAAENKRRTAEPPPDAARKKRPRRPRRVSGPLWRLPTAPRSRGSAAVAADPVPRTAPRPAVRPRPRVVPRPSPSSQPGHDRRRSAGTQRAVPRPLELLRSLPDHALLDRLVRGRAWIPLLGALLAGIVAMQVAVLKMNASIGRSIAATSQLEIRNGQLQTSVASLADDQRIERLAAAMGMVLPPPDMVGFLSPLAAGGVHQVLANIQPPDASTYLYSNANSATPGTPGANGMVVTPANLEAELAAEGVTTGGALGGQGGTSAGQPATGSTPGDAGQNALAQQTVGGSQTGSSGAQGGSPTSSQAASGTQTGSGGLAQGNSGGGTQGGSSGASGGGIPTGASTGAGAQSGASGGSSTGSGNGAPTSTGGGAATSQGAGAAATGAASLQPSGG